MKLSSSFLLGYLLKWFFSDDCQVCKQRLITQNLLCNPCLADLPRNQNACFQCAMPLEKNQQCGTCLVDPPPFSRSIVPFLYHPPISNFVTKLKFHQQLLYAKILGQLLLEDIQQQYQNLSLPQFIIPIPLYSQRLRHRGFNQALEIAKPIAKILQIPLLYDYCYRSKNTRPQSQLSARARKHNMIGAFALRKKISAVHVALIDDVMTTGHTVRALSQMLQKHGIRQVDIWCCARSL